MTSLGIIDAVGAVSRGFGKVPVLWFSWAKFWEDLSL